MQNHKIYFVENEVEDGFNDVLQLEGLGLLTAEKVYSVSDNVESVSYSFLHLSLQETLAAHHITSLSDTTQIDLLKNYFVNDNYFNMWIMYVGLTNGQSFPFNHFLSGNHLIIRTKVLQVFKQQQHISQKFSVNKVILLQLFQCFSEIKDISSDDMKNKYFGQLQKKGRN